MSHEHATAQDEVKLSQPDRARMEKLQDEIQSRLQELHSLGMRVLGHKTAGPSEIAKTHITVSVPPNAPAGTALATVRSIDITLDDGKGHCVRLKDPPGTCSNC
jgi:hypothetical protein